MEVRAAVAPAVQVDASRPRRARGSRSRSGPRRRRIPAQGRAAGRGTSRRERGLRARPSPAGCRRPAGAASSCRPTRRPGSSCPSRCRRAARLPRRAAAAPGSGARRGRAGRAARGRAGSWCSSLLLLLGVGDSVQDEPDDPRPRLLRRPAVPAAQVRIVHATALNARSAVSVGSSSPSGSDPSCAPSRRKWTNGSRYDAGPPGAAWWKASSVARSSGRWRSMTSHSASSPRANRSRPEPRTVRTGYIVERKSSASAPRRASTRASRPSPWRQSVERARPEASATRSRVRPSQPCSPSTWIAALRTRSSSSNRHCFCHATLLLHKSSGDV